MKITKQTVGVVIIGVALVLWSSLFVSWIMSAAIGLGFTGYCIMLPDEEEKSTDDD